MGKLRARWLILIGWSTVLLLGAPTAARYWTAARFLERLAHPPPAPVTDVATEELTLAGEDGPIRARLYYRSGGGPAPGVVVVHGVHYRGIDERRLVPFARALAGAGHTVLTPELADLTDYRITPSSVGVIQRAVHYLARRRDRVVGSEVSLIGFSFAGGLSLVAALDRATAAQLSSITSVGGHHDLGRVLHFLLHDEIQTPDGPVRQKAHDYGLIILVYGHLERFVPESDLPAMREAFRAWLHEDRKAARAAAQARTTAEADLLWHLLENGRLQTLAPALDQLLEQDRSGLAALSIAGRLRSLHMPIYLLHGSHDSVIPPFETVAADLELQGSEHRALVSPLLDHVEVARSARLADQLALLSFLARLL